MSILGIYSGDNPSFNYCVLTLYFNQYIIYILVNLELHNMNPTSLLNIKLTNIYIIYILVNLELHNMNPTSLLNIKLANIYYIYIG